MVDAFEQPDSDMLLGLLRAEDWDGFRRRAAEMDPADLADFVEDLEEESTRERVFELLDAATASEMIVEMETSVAEDLLEDLPSHEMASLAEQMAPDEAADFIGEMDEPRSAEVLAAMAPEERADVAVLLRHAEDTAGGLMTTEVLSCMADERVSAVRERVLGTQFSDPVLYVYVVSSGDNRLLGYLTLHDLMVADETAVAGDLTRDDCVCSLVGDDQESVARQFRKYDLWVMPVVDEGGRLVGRITVDDVIDVVYEEADEDLAHMVGAPDIEEEEESLLGVTPPASPMASDHHVRRAGQQHGDPHDDADHDAGDAGDLRAPDSGDGVGTRGCSPPQCACVASRLASASTAASGRLCCARSAWDCALGLPAER